jgi:hypothetical protein
LSSDPEPRTLGLVDTSASVSLCGLGPDATDTVVVDLLAAWLAEVSAEALIGSPTPDAEEPAG